MSQYQSHYGWVLAAFLSLYSFAAPAAIGENVKLSAKAVAKDADKKLITLTGDAKVQQAIHTISADKIVLNSETGLLSATGNCTYGNGRISVKESAMNIKIDDGKWSLVE